MARLGRAQTGYQSGHSTLRPPTVVDPPPPVIGRPIAVLLARNIPAAANPRRRPNYDVGAPTVISPNWALGGVGTQLADARNARGDGRRGTHYRLQPPATLEAAAVFVADPVRVSRTEPRRQPPTRSIVRPPVVVGPVVTYPPVVLRLTDPHRPAPSRSRLQPPTVVGPVITYRPVQAALTDPHRPAPTRSVVRPPQVVGPAIVYPPVDVNLAKPRQARQPLHSRLSPPQVVQAATEFVAAAIRTALAKKPRTQTRSSLRPPTVVDPAPPVDTEAQAWLTARPDPARRAAHSVLHPPTVVGPVITYPPVKVYATRMRNPRGVQSALQPPTVIQTTFPPVETVVSVNLARTPRRPASYQLAPPQVVGPVVIYPPIRVELTRGRNGRGVLSRLRPPATTAAQPVETTPAVSLARTPRRLARYELGLPQVVAPAAEPNTRTTLAPSRDVARRGSHPALRPPRVVGPVITYPPPQTTLAPQPRQARNVQTRLAPPAVIDPPFIPRPVRVTTVEGRESVIRRPARSVTTQPTEYPPVETVVRLTLTAHPQRRKHIHSLTQFFGILDVFAPVTGFYDRPTPDGDGGDGSPGASEYDRGTPGGASPANPGAGEYDRPGPGRTVA